MDENENITTDEDLEEVVDDVDEDVTEDEEQTASEDEVDDDEEVTEEDEEEDVDEDDEDDFSEDEDEDEEDLDDEDEETDDTPSKKKSEQNAEAEDAKEQESDKEAEKNRRLLSRAKDLLDVLGIETDDISDGMAEAISQYSGTSKEEYTAKEKANEESQQRLLAADLAELQAKYPEASHWNSITEMPPDVFKRFCEYRTKNIPAINAYAAANPDRTATAIKRSKSAQSKAHLTSNKPKGAESHNSLDISPSMMKTLRQCYPNYTKKQILALVKKVQ